MKLYFPLFPLLFILLMALFAYLGKSPKTYPDSLIERVETPGGPIIVFEQQGKRLMTFDEDNWNFVQSVFDPKDPYALPVEYTRYLTATLMYAPQAQRILMIGMGGGQTTTYLHHHLPDADITAIEIDPTVVEVARKHFGFQETENYHAVVMDGLEYLKAQSKPYDIILLDAFSDGRIPPHLATPEFYREAAAALSENGVVAQNIEAVQTPPKEVMAAMGQAFEHIDAYAVRSNFIIIGYQGALKSENALRMQARLAQQTYGLRYPLEEFLPRRLKIK